MHWRKDNQAFGPKARTAWAAHGLTLPELRSHVSAAAICRFEVGRGEWRAMAIDPSLWWDREALSRKAAVQVGIAQNAKPLYLAIAKEHAGTPAPLQRVAGAVEEAGSPMCLAWRPDLLHSTIYQQLMPQALQFLLPPAKQPPPQSGFNVHCSQRNHHRPNGK